MKKTGASGRLTPSPRPRKTKTAARQTAVRAAGKASTRGAGRTSTRRPASRVGAIDVAQVDSLQREVDRLGRGAGPARWNADPDDVQRSVVKLVLTIVEFLRQLLERQAIRRMDAGTITADETEAVGTALMRLEETVRDLCARFDLTMEDLNLDLGPVGTLR